MVLITIFSDAYGVLAGSALKRTHPVIRLKAEQPGCYELNYYLVSVSGRKFSITQSS